MLAAGPRHYRLRLQRAISTLDSFGTEAREWTTIATVWAGREYVGDGERIRSAEMSSEVTVRFQVLHSQVAAGLTPRDRVECDGLIFGIVAVKPLGFNQGIEISAAARDDLQ